MTAPDAVPLRAHEDPALFREALAYTAAETGFASRLIEKEKVDVSETRLAALRPQLDAQLKPVLRAADFAEFDLDRAFGAVSEVAAALGGER